MQERLETLVAGACRAVLEMVDVVARVKGLRELLQQAALLLAEQEPE